MELIPSWNARMANVKPKKPMKTLHYGLKKSVTYYAADINYISTAQGIKDMANFALQRPLSHIGFDTEFKYDRPGVVINKGNTAYDQRSIHPLLLSMAMVEPNPDSTGTIYCFVIDLRNPDILKEINKIFELPIPFISHFAKVELFCLWQLDLTAPRQIWDTCIFEKMLQLGRHHIRYRLPKSADVTDKIKTKDDIELEAQFSASLIASCQRYGVQYAMASDKDRLQKSFLIHDDASPFTDAQIKYSAEDAIAVAKLYPLQVPRAVQESLLHHCMSVEMPWVITNSRIEWNGVKIDVRKCENLIPVLQKHKEQMEAFILSQYGIANVQSHNQLVDFFSKAGIINKFEQDGKITFDKKQLKKTQDVHPAIPIIRSIRRAGDFISDKIMSTELIGMDGRMHPEHKQLGTDTGRQTSRYPNILGLDSMLRPLVIPEEGFGIGEVDWSQVEIGVSAAIYNDDNLIRMYNSGDVYSAMAQHFFRDQLPETDRTLPGKDFKNQYPGFRAQMKIGTLGLIYGITPKGLAPILGTSVPKAEQFQAQFMDMFPQMCQALKETASAAAIRGYATTVSGLKRYRAEKGKASGWEKNWFTNLPVQGSAAVVFKAAGNRLDRLYRAYNAKIIIPLHDSFIFEAPLARLEEVAELTSRVMCDTLREYFPELKPQAEVNIRAPCCWNKDGDVDGLEQWINEFEGITKNTQQQHNQNVNNLKEKETND